MPYLLFLKKRRNLKLSSAANYRWCLKLSSLFSAAPTNYGLLQRLQDKWKSQIADETRGDFLSTYKTSYDGFKRDDMERVRYAVPRELSTTLHPINSLNKDLHFRGVTAFKSPEKLPEMPIRSMTEVVM